jgi:hypothetical protein
MCVSARPTVKNRSLDKPTPSGKEIARSRLRAQSFSRVFGSSFQHLLNIATVQLACWKGKKAGHAHILYAAASLPRQHLFVFVF